MKLEELTNKLKELSLDLNEKYKKLGGEKYSMYLTHDINLYKDKIDIIITIANNGCDEYYSHTYDRLNTHVYNILDNKSIICDDNSFKFFENRFKKDFNILEDILTNILKSDDTKSDILYMVKNDKNIHDSTKRIIEDLIRYNNLITYMNAYRDRLMDVIKLIGDSIDLSSMFIYLLSHGDISLDKKSSNKLVEIYTNNILPEVINILKEEING